jgi:hypothetical protein
MPATADVDARLLCTAVYVASQQEAFYLTQLCTSPDIMRQPAGVAVQLTGAQCAWQPSSHIVPCKACTGLC